MMDMKFLNFLLILALASFAMADDKCASLCEECKDSNEGICQNVIATCECVYETPEEQQKEEAVQTMQPTQKSAAIIDVDFGHNGDTEKTAVKNGEQYDIKNRSNIGITIAAYIGGAALLVILLLI